MNVKTYRARTMQEALALVREDLGVQASVLQTREVRPRGLSRLWEGGGQVEVVASSTVSVPSRLVSDQPIVLPRPVPASHAGIDLSTPAEKPRGLVRHQGTPVRSRAALPMVVVAGGQPGVGTTTVALNLSMALARQGRRVVLVDADLVRGGRMPWIVQRDGGSILDVLAGRRSVHEVLARGPAGIQVLPGCTSGPEASAPAATWLVRQLDPLVPHADAVVVDAGCSRGDFARCLWQAACAVWITASPADEAILKAYAAIKSYAIGGGAAFRGQTFINRAEAREAGEVHARLAEACRRFLALPLALGGSASIDHSDDSRGGLGLAGRQGFDLAADMLWAQLEHSPAAPGTHMY